MTTKERAAKIKKFLSFRQSDLRVVLEDVTNTHNASAVVRTCDAAAILYLDVIYNQPFELPVNEAISTRAEKWLHFTYYSSTEECFTALKGKGFKIAATSLAPESQLYTEIDYTQPLAIVFGNEAEGISPRARALADYLIMIPMKGMVQSLNLSVSAGIILFEALRQRSIFSDPKKHCLQPQEYEYFLKKWLYQKNYNSK